MSTEDQKLEELKNLENSMTSKEKLVETEAPIIQKNELDGYKILSKQELPYFGTLYPESWQFAYRCPTTSEIAEFSTIDERDQLKIFLEISKIVSKCYIIVDQESQKTVNPRQINDGEKLFFFLKLREFYLDDAPITFKTMSRIAESVVDVTFMAHNLMYEGLNDELLECYDGRTWTIPTESFGLKDPIVFRQPTLEITDRIYKYIKIKSQKAQEGDDKLNKEDLNKKFIVILPFLYQTGEEKIESLNTKFRQIIVKNEKLYKAYVSLSQQFNLSHSEKVAFEVEDQIEETDMKFPGGWKKMFLSNQSTFGGLFGK